MSRLILYAKSGSVLFDGMIKEFYYSGQNTESMEIKTITNDIIEVTGINDMYLVGDNAISG